jgi:hypothetical protein
MDEALQDLSKSVECPCCYDEPRPGTTTVGMCNNGHMTCESCATYLINASSPCPICREKSIKVVKGHKLAVTVIQLMAQFLTYHCRHEHCTTRVMGHLIGQHEKECSHKPIRCPAANCRFSGGVYRYLEGMHKCVTVCPKKESTNSWKFGLSLNLVYSVDYNLARISDRFKPVVLKGLFHGFPSCAFINMASREDAILIYSGWLNQKSHMGEEHQNIRLEIHAYVNTNTGKIGQFVSQYPRYEGEIVESDEDGIVLSRETLYNWSKWSHTHHCLECDRRTNKPHMHIEVKMSF